MELRTKAFLILWLTAGVAVADPAANPWSEATAPVSAPPEVFGSYAAGCLAGAEALPLKGSGYRVMRTYRHRNFGHPSLIRFVRALGKEAQAHGLGPVLVGDLAQPRGGPMPAGHASHQSGLDVDIWLRPAPSGAAEEWRNRIEMRSVVQIEKGRLHPEFWSARERALLKLAATRPEVERIFVNPVIKRALCASERERGWLHKLRPWWGHDAHFHVRLACPPDSPGCRPQRPQPPGDGCEEDLDGWVLTLQKAAKHRPTKPVVRPLPELPDACATVLAGPDAPLPLAASER